MSFIVRVLARALATTAVLALAIALPGDALSAPLTPDDVAKIRTVVSTAMSPDGKLVAYTIAIPRDPRGDDNGPAWVELHVVGADGLNKRTYVGGEVNVSAVKFSPDGAYISYLAKRHGDEHATVWAIPVAGGESFRLVEHGASIAAYDWHPEGASIAFVAPEPEDKTRKKEKKKGFNQEIYEEDWHARRVYVASVPKDASGERDEAKALEGLPGQAWHVAWSPKGDRLAVDLSPTPLVDDRYMFRRLHVVDAAKGTVLAKIENPGKLGEFDWMADGRSILMISAADINDPLQGRLMAAPATGGAPRDLLPDLAGTGQVDAFGLTEDGDIVYLASVGTASRIGRLKADGRGGKIVYEGDGASKPVVSGLGVGGNGHVAALVAERPVHPPELFIADLRPDRINAGARRVTNSNPWLTDVEMGRQEVVEYAARDGMKIQGMLIHPVEGTSKGAGPMIVVAHGGPEAHYDNGWLTRYSYPGQMAAGKGYAIFYPNYRGSTGRGVAFQKADQGDGGGQEFLDVLDGVAHLVERGVADRARVGITGGSYGGFFTALGATRYSEHFAAGVMFVGISNQLSKAGTTDIAREMELVHWLTNVQENLELFLDRSPVLHTANANTPLLIMHGKEDPRVDPGQSKELFRALKLKGDVPVRLVLYPGEGHGNRKAAARLDYSLRMMRWFDHFLAEGRKDVPAWEVDYGLKTSGEDENGDESGGS